MTVQGIISKIKRDSGEDGRRRRQHPPTVAPDSMRSWLFPSHAGLFRAVLGFSPSTVGLHRITDVIGETAAINTGTNRKSSQFECDKITVHSDSKLESVFIFYLI